MAESLDFDFFKAAKSQLDQTVRWHVIVLAALLYLHVGIVAPFGARMAEKLAVDRDLAAQRTTLEALAPVSTAVRALGDEVKASAASVSDGLLADLVARFARLNEVVVALSDMSEDEAGGAPGRMLFMPPPPVQWPLGQAPQPFPGQQAPQPWQQQQQPQPWQQQQPPPVAQSQPLPSGVTVEPMPTKLVRLIARHGKQPGGADEFAEDLEGYIEEVVIRPAFDAANEAWTQDRLPTIDRLGEAATSTIASAGEVTGSVAGKLADAGRQIDKLRAQAQALSFAPPSNPEWWRTVYGKGASIRTMTNDLASGIEDAAKARVSLGDVQAEAVSALAEGEKVSKAIVADIAELEADAASLQSQLGQIGGPLKVVAFPLAVIAPLLPLIIGAASGIASLMTAEALRRMSLAVLLAGSAERRAALAPWLADIAGRDRMRMTARAVVLSLVVAGWILAAAAGVRSLEPAVMPGAAVAILALAFYLGCRLWLWRQARSALGIAEAMP